MNVCEYESRKYKKFLQNADIRRVCGDESVSDGRTDGQTDELILLYRREIVK